MSIENTLAPQPTDLMPEGIFDGLKETIFRAVIFSQKDRIKDLILTIVENTRGYTVAWFNENWDAVFEKLAAMMGLTLIPQTEASGPDKDGERYSCVFDPHAELVSESGEAGSIASFIAFILPIIMKLWIS